MLPCSKEALAFVAETRENAASIMTRKSEKIALLVGPCSIHDPELALEYARKLKELSKKLENVYIIMRLFVEKPRTSRGWKGLIYDPHLKGSCDIAAGIKISRQLLLDLAQLKMPCATELLDPLVVPYLEDLICWGMIGARTSASQPHRQLASGLDFPVGFKNSIHGDLDVAIQGVLSSSEAHTHISIDETGHICQKKTLGNPLSHLVLRGSNTETNYDETSITRALEALQKEALNPHLLIDCSHGNSQRNYLLQANVFRSCIEQIANGNNNIFGLMLESHLKEGKQEIQKNLSYGVSITDSCIGWEETESLIRGADEALSPTWINSVQR